MARIRTIKPEFWTDERVGECSPNARLLFLGTLNFADDHGGIERSAKQLKAQVFPYDTVDCEPLVQELLAAGLLVEYEAGGKKYLHIKGFRVHQKVEKPGKPRVPPYEPSGSIPRQVGEYSEKTPRGRESKGMEGKGREAQERARDRHNSPTTPRMLGESSANASRGTNSEPAAADPPVTQAAAVCIAMRAEGLLTVNSSNPKLLALLAGGAEIGEFVSAARRAVARGKDFAYALGTVDRERQEATALASRAGADLRGGSAKPRTWEPPDEEGERAQG